MKSMHSNQSRRLKFLLLGFLIAMAVPTVVLVSKSFEQLQWEAYYQHRQIAEDLAQRIDKRLSAVLLSEEQRSFGDYGFLQVEANSRENYLRRSPISSFPLESDFPGLLGYFQVDPDGTFSTPFTPASIALASQYGISAIELAQRREIETQLVDILSSNDLLVSKPLDAALASVQSVSSQQAKRALSSVRPAAPQRAQSEGQARLAGSSLDGSSLDSASLDDLPNTKNELADEAPIGAQAASQAIDDYAISEQRVSQAAFDNISKRNSGAKSQGKTTAIESNSSLSVEEVVLESPYQARIAKRKESAKNKKGQISQRQNIEKASTPQPSTGVLDKRSGTANISRKKTSFEPALVSSSNDADVDVPTIKIFENEIDPFELTLLDSGHWVLFRKVWREGQRYIQGMLIEQDEFLSTVFEQQYSNSLVASMSKLAVIYQGNVLSAYSKTGRRYNSSSAGGLTGTLLYRSKMASPFNELEGVYTINRLPAGAGSNVIWWAALVLAIVLLVGTYLLYRLGLRNLNLVNQQQDFVSAVSHELKTPLTSIRMYGEILKSGWADESKKQGYYRFIFDESERLTRLINNVLALAKMTRNETTPNLESTSVVQLLDVIRSKIDTQVEAAGFELSLHCDDELRQTKLMIDPDLFTQIVINLIDNALKFSINGEHKKIDITVKTPAANKVCFAIRDYGPGIESDQLKKVFELFYRSETELTRDTTGTGIGLALVDQFTRLMDGKVEVANRKPGAEFSLHFPIASMASRA